jgi:hypothetical protein
MKKDMKQVVEDFMHSKKIDSDARVEMPNGDIYLHNLLNEFATMIRDETLSEVVKETRTKISWT